MVWLINIGYGHSTVQHILFCLCDRYSIFNTFIGLTCNVRAGDNPT